MASAKERVWLEEYLKCWNASEAARRADYAWPGKMGTRKLAKFEDEIQERIDQLVMSADEALVRLSELARGEWSGYIREDGSVDIAALVRAGKAHLVSKIRDTPHGKSIEFCDMQRALEQIGSHVREGRSVALVTTAGTPGIADPAEYGPSEQEGE